jgi:hypothetical protein
MYKCGWNGCEKAYGTLNHLNAHVTMQGHGSKRTPDGTLFTLAHLSPHGVWRKPKSSPFFGTWKLTISSRVQGDPQGVEAAQEGRGSPAQGRGRAQQGCE